MLDKGHAAVRMRSHAGNRNLVQFSYSKMTDQEALKAEICVWSKQQILWGRPNSVKTFRSLTSPNWSQFVGLRIKLVYQKRRLVNREVVKLKLYFLEKTNLKVQTFYFARFSQLCQGSCFNSKHFLGDACHTHTTA